MGINFEGLQFGWMDVLVITVLLVGISRGRKRGMSEELLDVIKWVLIIFVGASIYMPVGQVLAESTVFNDFFCYLSVYLLTIVLFVAAFSYLRPRLGEKIVSADFFGTGEFYLGMVAGAFRYACIILVLLALLNARHYTAQEIREENAFQEANFGAIRFPTLITMQSAVFEKSLTGLMARTYLSSLLIQPTVPEEKHLARSSTVRARERVVDDLLDKR